MKRIAPSRVEGRVAAPASKSQLQRLLALSVLTPGRTVIEGVSLCDDVRAALRVATAMGVTAEWAGSTLNLESTGSPRPGDFSCGESGLALRMFSAVAALAPGASVLRAAGSLTTRPLSMLCAPLNALGASCTTQDGVVYVQGPLGGGAAKVEGEQSSQALTGLLLALPRCVGDSDLRVSGLKSVPYVELTLALLAKAGAIIEREGVARFMMRGGQRYQPLRWQTEGDWSGAAPLLVAGAIAGAVEVGGLALDSCQADVRVLDALRLSGARILVEGDRVRCERGALNAFSFDATDCPDLLPPLVALAAHCQGTSTLRGSARLRHKESDRAKALVGEFGRLGISVVDDGEALIVQGGPVRGGRVLAQNDHRIAMALAVVALGATAPVRIEGTACVAKSYERFFEDLSALGAAVSAEREAG